MRHEEKRASSYFLQSDPFHWFVGGGGGGCKEKREGEQETVGNSPFSGWRKGSVSAIMREKRRGNLVGEKERNHHG